ncbi:MAG: aminopeptidase P family protein [Candidatus Lokiarchaeota archaeon]|nr:aminopeptidase P family protein [Candidatus Lokiarchaeota archaeon]
MNKFEKAQNVLHEINGDGWLIICVEDSDINSRYMIGVASHARHYIYVAADGKHKIIAVEMEAPMIARSLKNKGIKAEVVTYSSMSELTTLLSSLIKKPRIALNIGEDILSTNGTAYADQIRAGDFFSVKKLAPQTEFISAAPIIDRLRSVKSSEELKDLRNVCKATLELLETFPDWVKAGMTENEVKAKLEYEYMKLGKPSFGAIVGTGTHSADPHHNTSMKKIEPGVLLVDTGLQIDEMCSDITWTFWVGKKPVKEFLNAYNALFESKEIAHEFFTDGTSNNVPAKKCREYLAQKGYDHEKLFFHGYGHSLGFEAHDIGSRMSWKVPDSFKLKENMVYTSEPGLYWVEKWGIRLEDDIIVGKDKYEKVTYNPKVPLLI